MLDPLTLDRKDWWVIKSSMRAKTSVELQTTTKTSLNPIKWYKMLKGAVHPKMKILSLFIHLKLVTNLYECLCSAEHKGRYFEESVWPGCFGAPLTSIVRKKKYNGSQWCPRNGAPFWCELYLYGIMIHYSKIHFTYYDCNASQYH